MTKDEATNRLKAAFLTKFGKRKYTEEDAAAFAREHWKSYEVRGVWNYQVAKSNLIADLGLDED